MLTTAGEGVRVPQLAYENRLPRVLTTAFFGCLLLIVASQAATATTAVAAGVWGIQAVAAGFFTWRAWRSNRLIADDSKVVVRTLLRTHVLPFPSIARFEAVTGQVGTWQRTYLVAVLRDGTVREFARELNTKPSISEDSSIHRLAQQLQELGQLQG